MSSDPSLRSIPGGTTPGFTCSAGAALVIVRPSASRPGPVEKLDDTLAVERFLASASVQSRVTQILRDWNHEVVARNLTALGAGDRPSVPIVDYCRAVRLRVDPMDRFRQMCSYLDSRGRSELTAEGAERE